MRKRPVSAEEKARREASAREFRAHLSRHEALIRKLDAGLKADDVEAVRAAIDEGAMVLAGDGNGRNALLRAIHLGATECALFLITPELARSRTQGGETPFLAACWRGRARVAQALAPLSDVSARQLWNHQHHGPMHRALLSCDVDTIRVALAHCDFWGEIRAQAAEQAQAAQESGYYAELRARRETCWIQELFDLVDGPSSPGRPVWPALDAFMGWMASQELSDPLEIDLRKKWEERTRVYLHNRGAKDRAPLLRAALDRRSLILRAALDRRSLIEAMGGRAAAASEESPAASGEPQAASPLARRL